MDIFKLIAIASMKRYCDRGGMAVSIFFVCIVLAMSSVSIADLTTDGLILNMDAGQPGTEPWSRWKPVVGPTDGGIIVDHSGEHLPTLSAESTGGSDYFWYYHFTASDTMGGQVGWLGTDVNFDYFEDFTVEIWFRADQAPPEGAGRGVVFADQANVTGYRLGVRGTGSTYYMEFIMRDKKGDYWRQFNHNGPGGLVYGDGNWIHIALTYNGVSFGSPYVKYYRNGSYYNGTSVSCADTSGNGACSYPLEEPDFVPRNTAAGIGARSFSGGDMFFRGDVAAVRVYDRVLSPSEIQANYSVGMTTQAQLPPEPPEPNEPEYPVYDTNYSVYTEGPHRENMPRLPVERRVTIAQEADLYLTRSDVTVTDSGKLICVFLESDGHIGTYNNIALSESTDGGRTWTPYRIVRYGGHSAMRLQKLDDGTLVISCSAADSSGFHAPTLLWSYDEGATWTVQHLWNVAAFEPARVHVLSNGDMVMPAQRPRVAGNPNKELEAALYRSYDMGVTWQPLGHLVASGYLKYFNEGSLVELPNQRLWEIVVMGYTTFSDDFGYTWSPPVMSPLTPARPCAELLQSGKTLVTHRNNAAGDVGYVAWMGDPEQMYDDHVFPIFGRALESERMWLESDRLVMDSAAGYWGATQYVLPRMSTPEDHVIFETRMRCLSAEQNGCSIIAGVPVQILPTRVQLYTDPTIGFDVDATQFHDYKIECYGTVSVKIWCDGVEKVSADISALPVENERYISFGNYFEHMEWATLWFGNNAGRSEWQSISVQQDAVTFPTYTWQWDASSGVYPDQYRRNRMVMLEIEGSNKNSDVGYGGWTQLDDGTIFVADYTRGDGQDQPVQDMPLIRGYFLYEGDFEIPDPDLLLHLDAREPGPLPATTWQPKIGTGGTLYSVSGSGYLPTWNNTNNSSNYHFDFDEASGQGGQVADFDAELIFDYDDDFTIEAWIRPQQSADSSANRMEVFGDQDGGANGYRLTAREAASGVFRMEFTMRDNVSSTSTEEARYQISSGDSFDMNQWTHVVAVYDGTAEQLPTMRIYGNGRPMSTTSQSDSWLPPADKRDFARAGLTAAIGVRAGQHNWFGGDIAVVKVYGRVLSFAEVLDNYNKKATAFGKSTIRHCDINLDTDCNLEDMAGLAESFLSTQGQGAYNEVADFDGDQSVDLNDIALFVAEWLKD